MLNRKKISKTGSISIPKLIRGEQGITKETILEVNVMENGDILLKKITPSCFICGSIKRTVRLGEKTICPECIKKAVEILEEENEQ